MGGSSTVPNKEDGYEECKIATVKASDTPNAISYDLYYSKSIKLSKMHHQEIVCNKDSFLIGELQNLIAYKFRN